MTPLPLDRAKSLHLRRTTHSRLHDHARIPHQLLSLIGDLLRQFSRWGDNDRSDIVRSRPRSASPERTHRELRIHTQDILQHRHKESKRLARSRPRLRNHICTLDRLIDGLRLHFRHRINTHVLRDRTHDVPVHNVFVCKLLEAGDGVLCADVLVYCLGSRGALL